LSSYIETGDIALSSPSTSALVINPTLETQLSEAASRLFDRMCEVPDDFFQVASDTATERTFLGNGANLIQVPPYLAGSLDSVLVAGDSTEIEASELGTVPRQMLVWPGSSGATIPLFLTDPTNWPIYPRIGANARGGWPEGSVVTVTAKWGYEAVPADVRRACIMLAFQMYRQSDSAVMAQVGDTKASNDFHVAIKETADRYRQMGLVTG
jgi:hypothetical protein